jgi:hypothetical protein
MDLARWPRIRAPSSYPPRLVTAIPPPSVTEQIAPPPVPEVAFPSPAVRDEIERHAGRNLLAMAWYFVVLRVAWIFKTESVIVPAYLDTIVGPSALQSTLRGCLPVLNRLGHSIPPLFHAERLAAARQKKWSLVGSTLLMAVPFLVLAAAWFLRLHERWSGFPYVFLALYALFFAATGLNELAHGTLQGKLIRPDRRGRLMSLSGLVGSTLAVTSAWFLLPWLLQVDAAGGIGGFGGVFAVCGFGFVLAALSLLPIAEPPGAAVDRRSPGNRFGHAWRLFVEDRRFRRMAIVAMLYMTMQIIFPHYQTLALANAAAADKPFRLMTWVVVQNAGVGMISVVVGSIADRSGNRLAVRCIILASAFTPTLAVAVANGWLPGGDAAFLGIFLLLGLSPVGMRTFSNYVLELGRSEDHPRYLSTLKLCMAVPFLLSPLLGYLIHLIGFTPVFVGVTLTVLVAGALTFTLDEPRHDGAG